MQEKKIWLSRSAVDPYHLIWIRKTGKNGSDLKSKKMPTFFFSNQKYNSQNYAFLLFISLLFIYIKQKSDLFKK